MTEKKQACIPFEAIKFTKDGYARITDKTVVESLQQRGGDSGEDIAALKNVGCCSVAAVREVLEPEALKNVGCCSAAGAELARKYEDSLRDEDALKNVGCCAVASADLEEAALKNVGCCSAPAEFEAALKNVGCCSAASELEALKNVGCCSAPKS